MSTEQNKAVVRRFITEVLGGSNTDVLDELLAPNYVNGGMGTTGPASFKGAFEAFAGVLPQSQYDIEDLVAEGDAVVARFTAEVILATGQKISVRGLTYYRLADGKIAEDDWFTTPNLMQEIEKLTPSPVTS